MELWIRSQNKEVLTKSFCLGLEERGDGKYSILNHSDADLYQYLGSYEYERALEVLDEIQNALLNKWANNVKYEEHYDDENPRSLVYEMPEE